MRDYFNELSPENLANLIKNMVKIQIFDQEIFIKATDRTVAEKFNLGHASYVYLCEAMAWLKIDHSEFFDYVVE